MEFNLIKNNLNRYFFDIPADCPYGLQHTAVYRQGILGAIPDNLMDLFLASGYRRNGNTLYTMNCTSCRGCIPIRIDPAEFRPNRSQKRILKKNQDIKAEIGPVAVTDEKLRLCGKFLASRYPSHFNSAEEYYGGFFINSITNSFEVRYSRHDRLIGVGIVDYSTASLNAVYFYFDPEEGARSPGSYNILYLLEMCQRLNLGHLYLGYWIKGVKAMSYKANFKPHQLLIKGQWCSVGGRCAATS